MNHWYNWYWALWLGLGFAPVEIYGLIRDNNATLSFAVWRWFDVLPGQTIWQWRFAHLVLAFFMIWLTLHFIFGIFR